MNPLKPPAYQLQSGSYTDSDPGTVASGNRGLVLTPRKDRDVMQDSSQRATDPTKDRGDAIRAAFAKHGIKSPRKPTRKQIETTLDVLGWLASGDQDGAVKDDISEIRSLLDVLLEVGY